MAINLQQDIPITYLELDTLRARDIKLGILRLDTIHPKVSGNKWFKLKENIAKAQSCGKTSLLTFGGAYSNHLIATAAAAKAYGLGAIGMVRGLHAQQQRSTTLKDCEEEGMTLHYLNRTAYARKSEPAFLQELQEQFPNALLIPEGGNNEAGLQGAAAIAAYIPNDVTMVALAVGTGTTLIGLQNGLPPRINIIGFPVMKGGHYLYQEIKEKLQSSSENWALMNDYHFGGFAKHSPELIQFMNLFFEHHKIPLDFVYTGKMMYGLLHWINSQELPKGTHILCIHTGGLQGNQSIANLLEYTS